MNPSLEQLKSAAYDTLVQVEQGQQRLTQLNKMIAEFKEEPKEEAKKDAKKS